MVCVVEVMAFVVVASVRLSVCLAAFTKKTNFAS